MIAIRSAFERWRPGPLSAIAHLNQRERLALLLGLTVAIACGALVSAGRSELALALAISIPVSAMVLRYPFAGVLIWLITMPFAGLVAPGAEAGPILWIVHRLGVPGLVALAVTQRAFGAGRRMPFRLGAIDAALALFLILGTANILLLTPDPTRQLVAFADRLAVPIALFWLIRLIAPGDADLRRLFPIAIVMIVFQTTVAALSWLAPSVLPSAWLGRVGERAVGSLGGPAPYTICLVFFSLLLLFWSSSPRGGSMRGLLLAVVGIGIGGVLLSLSRGSWLGAAAAFGGLVFIYPKMAARLSAVAIVMFALIAMGPLGPVLSRVSERVEDSATVEGRLVSNDAAIRMVSDRPLFGFGFNNFEAFDEQYKERVGDVPIQLGGGNHNSYLGLTAELGLPAALAYLVPPAGLLLLTFRRRRALRERSASRMLVLVLWLAIVDQFLASNFTDVLHSSAWATSLWWITLGLIAVELERVRGVIRRAEAGAHLGALPSARPRDQTA